MARVDVVMPKMGESVMEGTVLTWFKQPGETIELDETLLEIGTDKVDSEIPSPAEGVLEAIIIPEGETVEVGTIVAVINTVAEEAVVLGSADGPATAQLIDTVPDPEPIVNKTNTEHISESSAAPETEPDLESLSTTSPDLVVAPMAVVSRPATNQNFVDVVMPKMGESVMEGTVLTWYKQPGDMVDLDETLLEIGTDKVDSEIPSPAAGILQEILVQEGETVDVGTILARLGSEVSASPSLNGHSPAQDIEAQSVSVVEVTDEPEPLKQEEVVEETPINDVQEQPVIETPEGINVAPVDSPSTDSELMSGDGLSTSHSSEVPAVASAQEKEISREGSDGRFYSPLVRSIAEAEGLSAAELESIEGSGKESRVTKKDVLDFVQSRKSPALAPPLSTPKVETAHASAPIAPGVTSDSRVEIIKMGRMRKMISEHMTRSLATSAHVTSFAEADLTNLVAFRNRVKWEFEAKEGIKLTMTPFFVKAVVDALKEYPMMNSSVDGDNIILKKDLNVGIAVTIEKTGLIVPVIRNAEDLDIIGIAKKAGDLAVRARTQGLIPDELSSGTFTLTNVGSLGSLMGTPIISQPQVGILATGAIKKRPVVIEDSEQGDMIAIRNMMLLSLSYDHRIIDGAMGVAFLKKVVEGLESYSADTHDIY